MTNEKIDALFEMVDGGLHRVAQIERDPNHKTQVLADTVAYLANIVHLLREEITELTNDNAKEEKK